VPVAAKVFLHGRLQALIRLSASTYHRSRCKGSSTGHQGGKGKSSERHGQRAWSSEIVTAPRATNSRDLGGSTRL